MERRCPDCGDAEHLYMRGADMRWNRDLKEWVAAPFEACGFVDCTQCDWNGPAEQTEFKEGE